MVHLQTHSSGTFALLEYIEPLIFLMHTSQLRNLLIYIHLYTGTFYANLFLYKVIKLKWALKAVKLLMISTRIELMGNDYHANSLNICPLISPTRISMLLLFTEFLSVSMIRTLPKMSIQFAQWGSPRLSTSCTFDCTFWLMLALCLALIYLYFLLGSLSAQAGQRISTACLLQSTHTVWQCNLDKQSEGIFYTVRADS